MVVSLADVETEGSVQVSRNVGRVHQIDQHLVWLLPPVTNYIFDVERKGVCVCDGA